MAVKLMDVQTEAQAFAYAAGSASSARKGVCPSQEKAYLNVMNQVSSGEFGNDMFFSSTPFVAAIKQADAICQAAPDYYKKTGAPTAPAGSTSTAVPKVDPSSGGAAPDVTDIDKGGSGGGGGSSMWIWLLLGGAGLALLLGSKKGGKKGKKGKK